MKLNLQKGITLIEVLISLGLLSISIGGVTTLYLSAVSSKSEVDQFVSINQKRAELISLLRDKQALLNSIKDTTNVDFKCLQDKINSPNLILNCPKVTGNILRLTNSLGNNHIDLFAASGFTKNGVDCSEFGLNSACNFKFNITWTPKCQNNQCLAPDFIISGKLEIANLNLLEKPIRSEYFDFTLYQSLSENDEAICETTGLGSYDGSRCNLQLTQTKCDVTGEYFVGFNGDGSIRCEPRSFPSCTSGYLYGVDSNGGALCDPRTCI